MLNRTNDRPLDNDGDAEIRIRIVAAIPRSGSTLFMRIFQEAPECGVTSRLVLMGNHRLEGDFQPDYTIFHNPSALGVYQEAQRNGKSILISKEELGHECRKGECDYDIFPNQSSIERARPAFLFRDPIRVFDSWKAVGWTDMESLLIAYRKLYETWRASNQSAIAITYEELIYHPDRIIRHICQHWGIDFSPSLLAFQHPFGDFLFSTERERQIYAVDNPLGLFTTVQSNQSINADIKSHNLLTMAEKDQVEQSLGGMYMATYGDRFNSIRNTLSQKTHFGFDLDDTLHEFRKASGAASAAVFAYLAKHSPTTPEEFKATYGKILKQATAGGFADGKSSDDYRRERFTASMQAHEIEVKEEMILHLLILYKTSLQSALTLKPGASQLLTQLKGIGKTIVIVTEGPEDAQRWTLEHLGIADQVDALVTSNAVGKSKTDGLFGVVLQRLGIEAGDMVFVGDNWKRDVVSAREEGIMTVFYDEQGSVKLDGDELRINSLWKLGGLVKAPGDVGD
ncbi:MAG: hypothetical protein LQ346_005221 [Caloplaca aetnensis]|nr:MAG: hypothetical protein LQ346_005221 [Caloplaca aetnensis]